MYPVIRAKGRAEVLKQSQKQLENGEVLEYLVFPKLAELEGIEHIFTTRIGGASKGDYATLNFSFTRGDEPEAVLENYRRIGECFGVEPAGAVATDQTHTVNIRTVTKEDAGKGVTQAKDYADIDGLVTNEKGLVLACFTADCVPVYFVDPMKKVIGVAHSGWRGTVAGIGACMIKRMQEEFGCEAKDIVTAIGPSICQSCYEISEEVAVQFQQDFWSEACVREFAKEAYEAGLHLTGEMLTKGKAEGKYQLDLWLANYIVLRRAGVLQEHISMTDVCTNCNPSYLFSHRATGGKRGNLAAFLMLKE